MVKRWTKLSYIFSVLWNKLAVVDQSINLVGVKQSTGDVYLEFQQPPPTIRSSSSQVYTIHNDKIKIKLCLVLLLDSIRIARIVNSVQCHSLLSGVEVLNYLKCSHVQENFFFSKNASCQLRYWTPFSATNHTSWLLHIDFLQALKKQTEKLNRPMQNCALVDLP